MWKSILARLREPSTWAGVAVGAAALTNAVAPSSPVTATVQAVADGANALASGASPGTVAAVLVPALAAIFLPERRGGA